MSDWVVPLSGPIFEKIEVNRAEIEAWMRDCVTTEEIAKRLKIQTQSFRILARAMGFCPYPPHILINVKRHPELKPVLLEHGETEFQIAVAKRRREVRDQLEAGKQWVESEIAAEHTEALAKVIQGIADGRDRNQCIREARATGVTLEELGSAIGITRERIRQICDSGKVYFGERSPLRRFDYEAIKASYEAGLSHRENAKRFGCSLQVAHKAARDADREKHRENRHHIQNAIIEAVLAGARRSESEAA